MDKRKWVGRNLEDSAFSGERLLIWAVSIIALIGVIGMLAISLLGKPIPPQIQSTVMICLGAIVARIERKRK